MFFSRWSGSVAVVQGFVSDRLAFTKSTRCWQIFYSICLRGLPDEHANVAKSTSASVFFFYCMFVPIKLTCLQSRQILLCPNFGIEVPTAHVLHRMTSVGIMLYKFDEGIRMHVVVSLRGLKIFFST